MRGLLPRGPLVAITASAAAIAACIVLVAGLISGGASAGTAGGAERAARGSCPDTLCVFTDPDFTGQHADITKLGLSNKVDNQIPDQAASLINDRGSAAIFYAKRDGKGRAICINYGDGLRDLQEVQLSGFDSTRLIKHSCADELP
jgi:hypothetical protein